MADSLGQLGFSGYGINQRHDLVKIKAALCRQANRITAP